MSAASTTAPQEALELFHPLVRRWFAERVGEPTDVQADTWPRIAAGEHLLVTAPTGSGKTLTAFLWALDRLVRGDWPEGATSVLYVSPLKALNTTSSAISSGRWRSCGSASRPRASPSPRSAPSPAPGTRPRRTGAACCASRRRSSSPPRSP